MGLPLPLHSSFQEIYREFCDHFRHPRFPKYNQVEDDYLGRVLCTIYALAVLMPIAKGLMTYCQASVWNHFS